MKKIFFLTLYMAFISCKTQVRETDKLDVTYSENLETYFLAEMLSVKHLTINKQWEEYKLKTCKAYQPIVLKALSKFKDLENHKIAVETAKLGDTLNKFGYGNYLMMEVLLQQPNFKQSKGIDPFKITAFQIEDDKKTLLEHMITNYLELLYEFYQTENIGGFISTNSNFYQGAISEVKKHIPKNFSKAMEAYYGDNRDKYMVLISPMMPWIIEDHEGRGMSATIEKANKKALYEIMSPYVQVPIDESNNYSQFGFNYKPRAQMLTVHEFGHSFVNPELESYKMLINNYSYLFTNNLKEKMKSKGVGNWYIYVIESLVRLGEIRIAERQNNKERADYLRNYHTNQEFFIFLPQLEKKVIEFENNRQEYPMWKDFIPELIKIFGKNTTDFVNKKLK